MKDYNPTIGKTVLICTDSKSLCEVLLGQTASVNGIRMLLNTIQARIIIQLILGDWNIPGNDLANRAAKQATDLQPWAELPITFSSALNVIKKVPTVTHNRTRKIYTNCRPSIDNVQTITREEEVLIARICAGHHPS